MAEFASPQRPLPDARSNPPQARVVFDFTTTALWTGPPVGIVRVEGEFGRWALDHLKELVPAFFDPETRAFRQLSHATVRGLLAQDCAIDTSSFVSPARRGKRKTDRIPAALRPLSLWILQLRRTTLRVLERIRIGATNAHFVSCIDTLQRAIMNEKYRAVMVKPDGSRRAHLPLDMALGPPVNLATNDTLICAGAGWTHNDIAAIAELKEKVGFRFALFCYDIIPLMFPQFYRFADVQAHRDYCQLAFSVADLVIVSSHVIESDVRAYCDAHSIVLGKTAVCPLGAHIRSPLVEEPLPAGLERNRYALLVSTIEPRKGHRLIYDAWVKLLEAGIPQRSRFKLVFAGRVGWMVNDFMHDLRTDLRLKGTLVVITGAEDSGIAALYRGAAFCLYPSCYEGYGLPVVEAFSYGKAVLASTGGALPEVVDGFSPCLDPLDAEAWRRMLQTWIEDPRSRASYEERIRTAFRHPNWADASQRFFALVNAAARGAPSG